MIRFLEHKDIDKKKWDDCIDRSLNHSISAYSWYLDLLFENWSALILDDYEAVFPLPLRSKYKIHYLLQPLFIRCMGIYSKKNLTDELVNNFFDAIPSNIKLIDIYLKENIPFNRSDFKISKRIVQLLDLSPSYEVVRQSYHRSVDKNLRKAEKNGLHLIDTVVPELIAKQYQHNIGAQVEKLSTKHFHTIEKLMNAAVKNKCGITLGVVNKENKIIASAFFMRSKKVIYFSFGSADPEGKSSGAMYLMVDEIIKRHSEQCELFDFEGSDVEGIANFNKNFGAKDCVYLQVKKNTLPGIVKWISRKS